MRHRRLVGASLVLAFVVSSGRAADLGIPAPGIGPVYSWSGLYLGAHGGYGRATAPSMTFEGPVAGGQLGFNFQIANMLLLGLETDASGTNVGGTSTITVFGQPATVTSRTYAIGTGRARAGVVLGQFLLYGTGGLGWAANTLKGTVGGLSLTDGRLHTGYSYGGGLEWHFLPMLTVRAEYLHATFGSQTYFTGRVATGDIDANIFRVGIN
jgi:outer membrane immunogenic protein